MTLNESIAYFLHLYPAYKLSDVLDEFFWSFKYLLNIKSKFIAVDRLEQMQIALSPQLKKEQIDKIIHKYQMLISDKKVVDADIINIDRNKLRKLLNK